jgi:hypothetical protein
MPGRFHKLATYNGEVSRGIQHTPELKARMRLLQADFDAWRRSRWEAEGAVLLSSDGGEGQR